jgi:SpoIID/LytB domain protein
MNRIIDFFLPASAEASLTQQLLSLPEVRTVISHEGLKPLTSSETLRDIAAQAKAEYTILLIKDVNPALGEGALQRLVQAADYTGAALVYSDRIVRKAEGEGYTEEKHPVIDYQEGSIRDDFDFGPLLLIRTSLFKQWAKEQDDTLLYLYGGLYDLRLWLSRHGELLHLNEYLYTEMELDNRKSGEKQFDYVNPANRQVQIEMEKVATRHLKTIDALVDTSDCIDIQFDEQEFETEASVIIPVYNRVRTIADAVKSALSQETTFPFNVIVVDNHSTDGTSEALESLEYLESVECRVNSLEFLRPVGSKNSKLYTLNSKLIVLTPERHDLGIGGCWNMAINDPRCGRFAVQLDSDDLYSSPHTLQRIVDAFYKQKAAMIVGSYRICDFQLNTLPPGLIDHREWTEENGPNNALRINGLGAPRAFFTPLLRQVQLPNTSYGEDYAMGLWFSRRYRIGRIYDELYLCRRWEGNSDAALSVERVNQNNLYKDRLRSMEIKARQQINSAAGSKTATSLERFFDRQMRQWPEALNRYRDLTNVRTKELHIGQLTMKVQFNPARILSTGADISKQALKERPCFLCKENRPKEQISVECRVNSVEFATAPGNGFHDAEARSSSAGLLPTGRKNSKLYTLNSQLLVNPYPILPMHFTIPTVQHQPQRIRPLFGLMLEVLAKHPELTVFYNGPRCGASAPDHAHLQAGTTGILPLQAEWQRLSRNLTTIKQYDDDTLLASIDDYICPAMVITGKRRKPSELLFNKLYEAMDIPDGEAEPMMNIVAWREAESYVAVIFPRKKHRPDCYYASGKQQLMVSPGALDMAGLIITPREEDFNNIDAQQAEAILKECSVPSLESEELRMKNEEFATAPGNGFHDAEANSSLFTLHSSLKEPIVSVGIVSAQRIDFCLNGKHQAKGENVEGPQTVELTEGGLLWQGQQYRELRFTPTEPTDQTTKRPNDQTTKRPTDQTFTLEDVIIGNGFHWERHQRQTFQGTLRLLVEADKVFAINELPVEQYLESVISSEMSPTSSQELLKAHAVISRSWLLCQMQRRREQANQKQDGFFSFVKKDDELLRWYDGGEHTLFDVCADDHCQRYQGIVNSEELRMKNEEFATAPGNESHDAEANSSLFTLHSSLKEAVHQTCGQVLTFNGELCDTRFSKCCGGHTEEYQYCWEDTPKPYLKSVECHWCNTKDKAILQQVLKDYDQETPDFHDWTVEYTQEELSELVSRKLKMDFGTITDLIPLDRGKSGRIWRLKIVGTKRTFIIGKELEIRRTLSETHLYSSNFEVEKKLSVLRSSEGRLQGNDSQLIFVLHGHGWGHGVGLCQIGAAVMGHEGRSYRDILLHYYPGAEITQAY